MKSVELCFCYDKLVFVMFLLWYIVLCYVSVMIHCFCYVSVMIYFILLCFCYDTFFLVMFLLWYIVFRLRLFTCACAAWWGVLSVPLLVSAVVVGICIADSVLGTLIIALQIFDNLLIQYKYNLSGLWPEASICTVGMFM